MLVQRYGNCLDSSVDRLIVEPDVAGHSHTLRRRLDHLSERRFIQLDRRGIFRLPIVRRRQARDDWSYDAGKLGRAFLSHCEALEEGLVNLRMGLEYL